MIDINFENFKTKLIFYFDKYKINYNENIIKDFYFLTGFLLTENEKYNLTAVKDIDEIIIKHYIDSVMPLKYFDIPEHSKIIDIGTGAGFPSLPLNIMRRDLKIAFLDSSHKKINFIKTVLENINNNYNINQDDYKFYCCRAEDLGKEPDARESYDFAVSRAVARLNILCELVSPFIKTGGYFLAYKGKNFDEEISESEGVFKTLGLETEKTEIFELDSGEKRVIIKIRKTKKTPPKYPRKFAVITKNLL